MNEKNKNVKKTGMVKTIFKLLPITIKATPYLFLFCAVISILHGVSWGVQTKVQQLFFDSAANLVAGNEGLSRVFASLAMMGGVYIICQILNGIGNFLPSVMNQKAAGKMSAQINKKIARLSPVVFEDTEKLDDINKAEQGKMNAGWIVFTFVSIGTFYLPYFIFMGWYLFTLKPILAAAIILIFVPTALTQLLRTKIFAGLEDKSAPLRREYEYYEGCIANREYFKETRMLGGFGYFKKMYLEALDLLQSMKLKSTMKANLFELMMRMVTVAGYSCILLLLFDALMKQEISVGAFAAVFNSIGMLYGIMEEVICQHIGSMAQNVGTLRNYLNFLAMEEDAGSRTEAPGWGDIVLKDVTFSYPGAKEDAIKHASLTLKKGETLAIVGENGSGKSTLIRLLSGLYKPCEGNVTINGADTRELSLKAAFEGTSAVFQKYQKYQMTLEHNITISEEEKKAGRTELGEICRMAGTDARDAAFPQGYDTMLSREFDGVDLSGGQWQRVAIARGFYRDHHTIILDEPTAAIDPYEETRIYNQFAEMSKDKSAVIVTHRLGSVKLADRIVVMKDGEVNQIGTHEELIGKDGEYRRLYESQEQWYKEEAAAALQA